MPDFDKIVRELRREIGEHYQGSIPANGMFRESVLAFLSPSEYYAWTKQQEVDELKALLRQVLRWESLYKTEKQCLRCQILEKVGKISFVPRKCNVHVQEKHEC